MENLNKQALIDGILLEISNISAQISKLNERKKYLEYALAGFGYNTPIPASNEIITQHGAPVGNYNKSLPWAEKIKIALSDIGSGFVDDIVDRIVLYEPDLATDLDRVKSAVTYNASQLKTRGEIDAEPIGNKNKYIAK